MSEQEITTTPERTTGRIIPPEELAPLRALYEQGKYLTAYEQGLVTFGPLQEWVGTSARILAGRIIGNVGAPRVGQNLHILAYRHDPKHPGARYSYARVLLDRKGPLAAARFLKKCGDLPDTEETPHAEWYALHSLVYSLLRDFDAAEAWFAKAEKADANNAWLWVERSTCLEQEDRYDEALAAARKSLELRPWYRAGVQSVAHLLDLREQDEEALALLTEANERLESGVLAYHLAYLQSELGMYAEAEANLNRFLELAPLATQPNADDDSEEEIEPLASFRSDIAYRTGDIPRSIELARKVKGYFHEQIAERMEKAGPDAKVVQHPVPFVRQHHVTCAPATLTAISRFWNRVADHLSVVEEICYDGTPAHSERKWAEENGWTTREFTLTWESAVALLDQGAPFTLATMGTGMGHLQAIIGYDARRGTLLIRDPYYRHIGEVLMPELLTTQRSSGPRAMAMVPKERADLLTGIDLPEADLYDREFALQTHLVAHRREEAQAEYEAMVAMAPNHRLTLYARRALAAYDGNLTELLACADALIAEFPEDSNIQLFRLSLLRELSRREERLKTLEDLSTPPVVETVAEATPESAEVPAPGTEAPLPTTQDTATETPDTQRRRFDPIFWMQYAQELSADAREHTKALGYIRRTLMFSPTNGDALHLKADIFWQQRRFEEALELYRASSCLSDKDENLAYSYFRSARFLKRTEQALSLLRSRYNRFGTRSSFPARTLFYALYELDRTHEALELLEEALLKRPDDGDFLTYAASRYAHLGKFDRADALMQAAEGKLSKTDALRARADMAVARGENVEALSLWRSVLDVEPLAMDAHRSVANLLATTSGAEAVNAHFETATERFPHHYGLHHLWAESVREPTLDKVREATLARLVEINPADSWTRQERAMFFTERNRIPEAIEEAKIAYQMDPSSSTIFTVRGHICIASSRFEEARASFREAIRLSVDNDYAIAQLMRLCDTTQQRRDSLAFIRQELTRQTIFGDGLLAYRRHAQDTLTSEELLQTLHTTLQERPDLWHAWSATITQMVETRRLDEAVKFARLAVERFPLIPPLWLNLAEVHQERGEMEEEQAILQQAIAIRPNWSLAIRELCYAYERARQPEKAVELLTAALSREPLSAENNWALASTLWNMGKREEAIVRLKDALRVEPRYSRAWAQLDEWGRILGREEEVVQVARDYGKRAPREAFAHLTLARVLPTTDNYRPERLAHLDEAIRLSPRLWDAYELKAHILSEARRWDEAFNACRPTTGGRVPPVLLLAAARIEAKRTGVREAIQRLRGSLASEPQFYEGWQQLADWNRAQGPSAARAYLEATQKLTEVRPQEAVSWGYLSDARIRNNDRAGSKAALQHAFDVDREYSYAGFALMDMQLEDGELNPASATLAKLDAHSNDPWVAAFGIRLSAKQKEPGIAQQWLTRLVTWPQHHADDIRAAMDSALTVFMESGWTEQATQTLSNLMRDNADVRSEAGGYWVQLCLGENQNNGELPRSTPQWSTVEGTLPYLRARGEVGVEAMAAYIKALGNREKKTELNHVVRDHWDYLRTHARTWAAVGQALLKVKDERLAADWCADWEMREDLTPRMYMVPVDCARRLNRDAEGLRASRKALEHRLPDHSEPYHATWVALDAALVGNLDEAVPMMERVGDSEELPPNFRFLYGLALAIIRVLQVPSESRRPAFNQAKDILDQTRTLFPNARENPVLTRYYSRAVKRIASDVGGPMAQMWGVTSARL